MNEGLGRKRFFAESRYYPDICMKGLGKTTKNLRLAGISGDSRQAPLEYKSKSDTDRLCGLVVRVPDYRSRGLGSINGATRFSEK
jgi:hypothetical protein